MGENEVTRPIVLGTALALGGLLSGLPAAAQGPAPAQPSPVQPSAPVQAPAAAASAAVPVRAQASIPLGVTIVTRSIERGEDAVVVTVIASFDSRQTNSVMLANEPTFLRFGEDQRLSLRQPADNRDLRIRNGQSMEGQLVFPGFLPPETREVTLVFNDGQDASDISAPGLSLRIPLPAAP